MRDRRSTRKRDFIILLAFGIPLAAVWWFIYLANWEFQKNVIWGLMGAWGWIAAVFKLAVGAALLVYVRSSRIDLGPRIPHALVLFVGLGLLVWGAGGLLVEIVGFVVTGLTS